MLASSKEYSDLEPKLQEAKSNYELESTPETALTFGQLRQEHTASLDKISTILKAKDAIEAQELNVGITSQKLSGMQEQLTKLGGNPEKQMGDLNTPTTSATEVDQDSSAHNLPLAHP